MGRRPVTRPTSRRWRVKRDVDVIALAALVISVSVGGWQFYLWTRGPQVRVFPPPSIALYEQLDVSGKPMVRFAARTSYVNRAQEAYGTVIVDESATLELGDLRETERWNGYGSITSAADGSYQVQWSNELAQPEVLPGDSAVSKFVLFATSTDPKFCGRVPCDKTTNELRPQELVARDRPGLPLRLTITLTDADGRNHTASCSRILDAPAVAEMKAFLNPPIASYIRCDPIPDSGRFFWISRFWPF